MNLNQKIELINKLIANEPFLEIEISNMTGVDLMLVASKDFTYSHSLEIIFKNVYHLNLNVKWDIDTKIPFIKVLSDEESYQYNGKFKIEQGYIVFALSADDFSFPFYIAAKDIEFNDDVVLYYKKEELQPGERLANWI